MQKLAQFYPIDYDIVDHNLYCEMLKNAARLTVDVIWNESGHTCLFVSRLTGTLSLEKLATVRTAVHLTS
jgi:hypothetical protein